MPSEEDPRNRVALRGLVLSWTFFTVFVAVVMLLAALFRGGPPIFGLPRWIALSCIIVPTGFVLALIPLVEKLIPDIPLSDDPDEDS